MEPMEPVWIRHWLSFSAISNCHRSCCSLLRGQKLPELKAVVYLEGHPKSRSYGRSDSFSSINSWKPHINYDI